MKPGVEVSEVDPEDGTAFDAWFDVRHVIDQERWPGQPGWQRVERLALALDHDGPEDHLCLVARTGTGRVCGFAELVLYRRENLHLAHAELGVLPADRRRGVGTALLAVVAERAAQAGRTELGGMDESPVRAGYEDSGTPFALQHGLASVQTMVRRELALPLSPGLAESPRGKPTGYTMITFADRWPDELIDDRCELGRRMSTDAPMGEQELDEEVWDEARVRQIEAALAAQNRAKVTTVARHDGSGAIAGFTEIVVPLGAPQSVWQHDTLVVGQHRGHGLGFAMKAANLAALVERHPAVRTVNTWNAAENEHMIATNDEMGFTVTSYSTTWLKTLRSAARPGPADGRTATPGGRTS